MACHWDLLASFSDLALFQFNHNHFGRTGQFRQYLTPRINHQRVSVSAPNLPAGPSMLPTLRGRRNKTLALDSPRANQNMPMCCTCRHQKRRGNQNEVDLLSVIQIKLGKAQVIANTQANFPALVLNYPRSFTMSKGITLTHGRRTRYI